MGPNFPHEEWELEEMRFTSDAFQAIVGDEERIAELDPQAREQIVLDYFHRIVAMLLLDKDYTRAILRLFGIIEKAHLKIDKLVDRTRLEEDEITHNFYLGRSDKPEEHICTEADIGIEEATERFFSSFEEQCDKLPEEFKEECEKRVASRDDISVENLLLRTVYVSTFVGPLQPDSDVRERFDDTVTLMYRMTENLISHYKIESQSW